MPRRQSPAPAAPLDSEAEALDGFHDGFHVERRPLEAVTRYPNNPRRNEAAVVKVAASIREFGWQQPLVVDEAGVIIVGDTRYLAARMLGLTHVPVKVARGLTPAQVAAYRLADNRVGEEAEWDDERLVRELLAIEAAPAPLELTGFEEAELDRLLRTPTGGAALADPEAIPPVPVTPKSRVGELYQLGEHRLYVGDSTRSESWQRLLAGVPTPRLLWTDPPYDVAYDGGPKAQGAAKRSILNDNLGHEGTVRLLRAILGLAQGQLEPGSAMYICAPHGPQFYAFAKVATELGCWRQTILWVKDAFALHRGDYHYRHEAIVAGTAPGAPSTTDLATGLPLALEAPLEDPDQPAPPREAEVIMYGWPAETAHRWYGGRRLDTVWEEPKPRGLQPHPTAKPVSLVRRALRASSQPGEVVIDGCAGGGSLLIAAHEEGRRACVIELDPRWADVIIQRWVDVTGGTPVRLREADPTTTDARP